MKLQRYLIITALLLTQPTINADEVQKAAGTNAPPLMNQLVSDGVKYVGPIAKAQLPKGIIGVAIQSDTSGIVIVGVIPNYPAEKAGIQKGDIITGVDTVNVKYANPALSNETDYRPGIDDINSVRKLIAGEPGKDVEIHVYRLADKQNLSFQIKRQAPLTL